MGTRDCACWRPSRRSRWSVRFARRWSSAELRVPSVVDVEVEAVPNCPSCREPGEPLYSGLRDHTFETPGEWACSHCPSCGAIWLNPRPTVRDIGKVYRQYYTHRVYAAGEGFRSHLGRSRVLT